MSASLDTTLEQLIIQYKSIPVTNLGHFRLDPALGDPATP